MELTLITEWINAIIGEIRRHKNKVLGCFAAVTFVVIAVGFVWPQYFESKAVIFVDQQNIIQPLLKGSAEVTRSDGNQSKVVKERMLSKEIMEQVAIDAGLIKDGSDEIALSRWIGNFRSGLTVNSAGTSYIIISYLSLDPDEAYRITSAFVNAYLQDRSKAKREESAEAFNFIDRQVKAYKEQLREAEDRLKRFKGENSEGTQESVENRKLNLRSQIEELRLRKEEAQSRTEQIEKQLKEESEFTTKRFKEDFYRERIAKAQAELDTLRLSYEETYPDIVALKLQIQDLTQAMLDPNSAAADPDYESSVSINPVYEDLRSQLSASEIEVGTLEMRINATQKLLDMEFSRGKRVAEYQAELSELTRDYDVTRSIYEDMLGRKEKARLSMTLDIEGQGITYKIQIPPNYPEVPVGLRFLHFYMAAPIVGIAVPIGLVVLFILLDPRVRFASNLEDMLPENTQLLGVISHLGTPRQKRIQRSDYVSMLVWFTVIIIAYLSVAVLKVSGLLS